jgi:hypothetical protein
MIRKYYDPWTGIRITERRYNFIQKRIEEDKQLMLQYDSQIAKQQEELTRDKPNPNQWLIDMFHSGNIKLGEKTWNIISSIESDSESKCKSQIEEIEIRSRRRNYSRSEKEVHLSSV